MHPWRALLALCLALPGDDGFLAAVRAHGEGRFADAVLLLQAEIAARGAVAPGELHLDLAIAALAAGQLDVATAALPLARERAPALQRACAFVAGGIAWQRGEALVRLAQQVESEPFAWRPAFAQLEAGLLAWQEAAGAEPDWPAARRNVERAQRRLLTLRREQEEQERTRRKQAGAEARPLLVPDGATSPPSGPGGAGERVDAQDNPLAPLRTELTPAAVSALFARIEQKERQKLALRAEQRRQQRVPTERDW